MTQMPQPSMMIQPHRGTLILVLGILGVIACGVCGIVAWVMGNNDLRAMDAGTMDSTGRGTTQAGKILGIVGTILWIIWTILGVVLGALFVIGAGAAAAASRGH